jgi:hypothetical protein
MEDLQGKEVVDSEGKKLGHIVDILFDQFHTENAYVEIESDSLLGLRTRHFLAPVAASQVEDGSVRVACFQRELHDMPDYNPSQPFSEEYETALLGFWGTQFTDDAEAVRDPFTERPGELHSMRREQFDDDPVDPHSNWRILPKDERGQ